MTDLGLQSGLNLKFGTRDHDCEEITEYHRNRARNVFAYIESDVLENPHEYRVKVRPTEDLRAVARLIQREDRHPAGGWYLVKEQRNWLHDQLIRAFDALAVPAGAPGSTGTVKVLEAGVASYVHHYTYLEILARALSESTGRFDVELVVSDVCRYPLLQVESLNRCFEELANLPLWRRKLQAGLRLASPVIDFSYNQEGRLVTEQRVRVDPGLLRFVQGFWPLAKRIRTTQWHLDLANPAQIHGRQSSFDVITEHYLTSMSGKNMNVINKIRANYRTLLKKGGVLLCAAGLTEQKSAEDHRDFLRAHTQNGFELVSQDLIWDIYDLSLEQRNGIELGQSVFLDQENSFSVFVKVG